MNIWFTSDSHYAHRNISGKKESTWKSGYRDFNSTQEMNNALVKNINDMVKEGDTLYHLGDWSFGRKDNIKTFRDSIICKNIHLVLGNHDEHIEESPEEYLDCFSSINQVYKGYIGRNYFYLSHYSNQVWPKSHRGSIHLFGHSHNSISPIGKSMDVGVDAHPEFRPFHINEILMKLDKKDLETVDHHGRK